MTRTLPTLAHDTGTVAFWRSAAPSYGVRSWRSAMVRFAKQHGRAIAHMADDTAHVVACDPDGRITQERISVRWT